jgi:hypothetical protein
MTNTTTIDAAVRKISCFESFAVLVKDCRETGYVPTIHLDREGGLEVADALAAEGLAVFTRGEAPQPAAVVLPTPLPLGGDRKVVRHVVATFTGRDGSEGRVVREVTRSTGHHVFCAEGAGRNPQRIASDTTGCRLHQSVPQYLAAQLEAALADRFAAYDGAGLSCLRMTPAQVRAVKRDARKLRPA